jgi:hypothetical protein
MIFSFLIIGVLTQYVDNNESIARAQVSFMAIWAFAYQASIGAAGYSLMAEVPTSRLRGVTQSLGTAMNGLSGGAWAFGEFRFRDFTYDKWYTNC